MKKITSAIVLGDILEINIKGRVEIPSMREQQTLSLGKLLRLPFLYGANIECTTLTWNDAKDFRNVFYAGQGLRGESHTDWLAIYNSEPSRQIVELCREYFSHALVIGFYLPPVLRRALALAQVCCIHLAIHPARFMKDLVISLSSNDPKVMELARSYSISREDIYLAANIQIARYSPNHMNPINWLYPDSILITPQAYLDAPCIDSNGHPLTLLEFADEISTLVTSHKHTYVYQPHAFSTAEKELLTSLGASFVESPLFETLTNQYMLLTHPSITHLAGLQADLLSEAHWFDKPVTQFTSQCVSHDASQPEFIEPVPLAQGWVSPQFCQKLVGAVLKSEIEGDLRHIHAEPPNLRLILRGGGSEFDDASSYSQCCQLGRVKTDAQEAQRAVSWIASGLAGAYSGVIPAQKEIIPARKHNFAIFAAGDENILVPAIVALRSFGLHLNNAALYYVAGKNEISQAGQAMLERHGITLLTSTYHHDFKASYRSSPPAAYLQLDGQRILADKGYFFSLGIQPDTLCIKPFNTDDIFEKTRFIAAPRNIIQRISWGLKVAGSGISYSPSWKHLDDPGFIPSLLFCNHKGLAQTSFLERAKEYFYEIGAQNLTLNEETLLHYFHFVQQDFCAKIDEGYSFLPNTNTTTTIYSIHYDYVAKPWKPAPNGWTARVAILYNVWFRAAKQLLETGTFDTFIAGLKKKKNIIGIEYL